MTPNLNELKQIFHQSLSEHSRVDRMFVEKQESITNIEYRDPIINLFLWNIIEKIDALIVLFENDIGKTSESIVRDLFENYINLLFMIRKKDNRYAYAYVFQTYLEEKERIEKILEYIPKEDREREFYNKRTDWLESRINSEIFVRIKSEWEFAKERRNIPYPKWYCLFNGPRSFRQLCQRLDHESFFEHVYGSLSLQTHSFNILNSLSEETESWGYLNKIRNHKDSDVRILIANKYATGALFEFVRYFHFNERAYYRDIFLKINPKNVYLFK